MFLRLGAAMNSGRGMFLFGFPGNGKTSIAERVTRAFGEHIWIPRSIGVDGDIIRVFDPSQHDESPPQGDDSILLAKKIDTRWVRVKRPTIIVGGELTMDNLELARQTVDNCSFYIMTNDFNEMKVSKGLILYEQDELRNLLAVIDEKAGDLAGAPA